MPSKLPGFVSLKTKDVGWGAELTHVPKVLVTRLIPGSRLSKEGIENSVVAPEDSIELGFARADVVPGVTTKE